MTITIPSGPNAIPDPAEPGQLIAFTSTPAVCKALTALDGGPLGRFDLHPATRLRMETDGLIEADLDRPRGVRLTERGRAVIDWATTKETTP
jgi:hypothetical protein